MSDDNSSSELDQNKISIKSIETETPIPIQDPIDDPIENPIEDPIENPIEAPLEDPIEEPKKKKKKYSEEEHAHTTHKKQQRRKGQDGDDEEQRKGSKKRKKSQDSDDDDLHSRRRQKSTTSGDGEMGKRRKRKKDPVVIAFVNGRSGGQMGSKVMEKLGELIGEERVFDLSDGGPVHGLEEYEGCADRLRVICCGGDGTVCWVLSVLDTLAWPVWPSIAILPLGTGNDLSHVLLWGSGYTGKDLAPFVENVMTSTKTIMMDRWLLDFQVADDEDIEDLDHFKPHWVVNNYVSIGIGAKICLDFHQKRESNPELFSSTLVNKGWYGAYGVKGIFTKYRNLYKKMKLFVDDEEVEIPKTLQTIVLLNIPSYSGGVDLWGVVSKRETEIDPSLTRQSISDTVIEVVGMKDGFHIGAIQGGMSNGIKITQGHKVEIELWEQEYAQVDGEPFKIPPSRITFTHQNQATMLFNQNKDTKGKGFKKIIGDLDQQDHLEEQSLQALHDHHTTRMKDSLGIESTDKPHKKHHGPRAKSSRTNRTIEISQSSDS